VENVSGDELGIVKNGKNTQSNFLHGREFDRSSCTKAEPVECAQRKVGGDDSRFYVLPHVRRKKKVLSLNKDHPSCHKKCPPKLADDETNAARKIHSRSVQKPLEHHYCLLPFASNPNCSLPQLGAALRKESAFFLLRKLIRNLLF
jgi:hypothetical protein